MGFLKNKFVFGALIALVTTALFSGLILSDVFKLWQLKFSDGFHASRPVSSEIVIVVVDQDTIDPRSGLGASADWSREIYAKALENINKYGPSVVAFDFYFRAPRDEQGDFEFRNALAASNNPVIFFPMDATDFDPKGYFIQKKGFERGPLPLEIFKEVENMTVSTAILLWDPDQVRRRMMPFVFDEKSGEYYENLPFAVARKILNEEKPNDPVVQQGQYSIGDLELPLEDGQMIINYASIPFDKTYKRLSFLDVYKENFDENPEELFKDKVVFIGPSAFFFNDNYDTPTTKENKMNGVEIHANALQTILDQAFLRNMTTAEKIALIAILAILSAGVFMFTRIRWSVLFLIAVPTAYAFAGQPAFNNGLILDLVHPYLTIGTVFVSTYMYRYVTEFKEKMALKGAFAKYVNPTLAKQIAEHPEQLKLGGEKREVTVLFTDIAHFTSISEQLKPESLVALLNEYFQAMSEVIMAEGGTVDKFEGDAIMAFFGAPLAQPDHALRACRVSLAMRQRLQELLQKWEKDPPLPGGEKKPVIDFRCGLSAGEVIVGNIGSSDRFEYTVMGDIVNLGSRLEGANKKYSTHTMISEATYEKVKDQFEMRELDVIKVVGKTQPIKVYELLNFKGQLVPEAANLLKLYSEGIQLYHERKFADALAKFNDILKAYPGDGPSQLYRQRCEVLRDFPPPPDWDGVFEMGSK